MIQIEQLSFSYGTKQVLSGIDMTLQEGRIYGLLGENGVGKTTLLTLLAGLKAPGSGRILCDGLPPVGRSPKFLASQYYLADENIAYRVSAKRYAEMAGPFWPGFDMDKFLAIMKEFETDPAQKMNSMSAGQLRKTHISFALALNVKYLFMDEPTNALDIPSKSQFRSAVLRHCGERTTIVISTHQVRDLESIIDPIIILDKNAVLLNATIEEIGRKLYFDYGNVRRDDALYCELLPGSLIQVVPNTTGEESKVNIEALFNTIHAHKDLVPAMFRMGR